MAVDNFELIKEDMNGYKELNKDTKEWLDLQKFF